MTTFVSELSALPDAEAADLLRSCCGASAWVEQMVAKRPFNSGTQLLETANQVWNGLSTDEKREAFDHHPRIGEKLSAAAQTDKAKAFAEREQANVRLASSSVHVASGFPSPLELGVPRRTAIEGPFSRVKLTNGGRPEW